ncbi:formate hydrogenlyase regulator HycA [Klebsiella aerogenes]|uniref:formate hydrogenlyase regulator HycA n=1 Tax=Klebsiella aerogenes TaxID=548 RepID=UPI0021B17D77|nr:formate hydrogenlyase regulator HycA [Klebsiella aerogenes]HBU7546668.1 formate hydrogenlyase regulator HycA [Klebsiella aerogenes]HBV5676121.1 formate hydrogenlyase regulator HycA [Klebsiella aerogenes]HCR2973655.1 formate hydrogenlyase regulator HycA [Klebsiella aerogenes]
MTIWELSEKADYIADRHRQHQEQWHTYCNSLVQGITLSKARLHHAMSCAPDKELCFVLFGHFQVYVALAEGFNSHTIEYFVESKNGDDKRLIAQATLDAEGVIDGRISNRSREAVLEHYLAIIATVYDRLYEAMERDQPVDLNHLAQVH